MLHDQSEKPIYKQIAEWLEEEILAERLQENAKVYSQYQLAEIYTINPATASKGLAILVEEGTLFKKRGLGCFVSPGAQKNLLAKRKATTLKTLLSSSVKEAGYLGITKEEFQKLVEQEWENQKGDKK
ncbi:GntR family transcriptional regulator [Alkalicoccus daliensis]|uniref:DNA-binding transcriptional regulator YhcF, GntR family n=1 Tax=Alkalicoccus daliensis TaxID=745820 RepID=A0A1H0H1E7_9BACI|nr:GntR family transcriptional regulator [Alkalicoccus daliensis]SDO12925.1 DNA-binding transcriptional regulator YhcF, GntR family [Alkalicoccus daliensis]